ncbi:hypothetical protein C8Q75DRAFT_813978 [Abortiporus biennis]|nr:hypothetical protein C8Q75DRAFT_813978 [Abortiporus biennis]
MLVGENFKIPLPQNAESGGYVSAKYQSLGNEEIVSLMECYNDIAECLQKQGDIEEALDWLEEVHVIAMNCMFHPAKVDFASPDWIDWDLVYEPFLFQRIRALILGSDIFLKIGNTASAHHRLWRENSHKNVLTQGDLPQNRVNAITDETKITTLCQLRHPDPSISNKLTLTHPNLQVMGSWEKLTIPGDKIESRMGFAGFVWHRRIYIAGGQKDLKERYRDIQWIDMDTLDGWHKLPNSTFPVPFKRTGDFTGWEMVVHDDKAYLFRDVQKVHYFDLVEEKWEVVDTKWIGPDPWPYSSLLWVYPGVVICRDKMYVFGGRSVNSPIGTNVWTVLDLKTYEWKKLGGYPGPTLRPDFNTPGPRRSPIIWVEGEKIWLQFGLADREGAKMLKGQYAAKQSHVYEDLWSWDLDKEEWRRERLRGNVPCPRAGAAYTYNSVLNKTIVFGGFHPALISAHDGEIFQFSLLADTFVLDPASDEVTGPKWKQVLTPGFPTYRMEARLFSDPVTGRIFLFGGCTDPTFVVDKVRSKKGYIQRSFSDLWTLKLDIPGGFFRDVDLEDEARTAQAGPWQRCFTCGSTGPWKRCHGSCNGKVFFCGSDCQAKGWQEHKEKHGCSKVRSA